MEALENRCPSCPDSQRDCNGRISVCVRACVRFYVKCSYPKHCACAFLCATMLRMMLIAFRWNRCNEERAVVQCVCARRWCCFSTSACATEQRHRCRMTTACVGFQEEIPEGLLPLRPSKAQCAWRGVCAAWLTLASYSVTTDILATAGHILAAAESSIRYEPTTSRLVGPPRVPG